MQLTIDILHFTICMADRRSIVQVFAQVMDSVLYYSKDDVKMIYQLFVHR